MYDWYDDDYYDWEYRAARREQLKRRRAWITSYEYLDRLTEELNGDGRLASLFQERELAEIDAELAALAPLW